MKASAPLPRPESSVPDFMATPFDRPPPEPEAMLVQRTETPIGPSILPSSGLDAIVRGVRGRCPRCNDATLFRRFLKPR
jgi:hypothetical protein